MREYMCNIIIKTFALLLTITAMTACSNLSVTSDWDPGIDFSRFRTFILLDDEQPINRLIDQRIRSAIVTDLTSSRLRKVDTLEQADLAIGYTVTTETRTTYHTIHNSMGAPRSFRHSGAHFHGGAGTSRTIPHSFTVGTLVIAVYQVDKKQLVWEGSASGAVSPSGDPDQSQQRINDAVQEILKDFPPGVKSAK